MAITPGEYLRRRREASGLTRDDIALDLRTVPSVSALARTEWVAQIEADLAPVTDDIARALVSVEMLQFDHGILLCLADLHAGLGGIEPELCRECACSWFVPCADEHGQTCAWADAEHTICTACAPSTPTAAVLPVPGNDAAGVEVAA